MPGNRWSCEWGTCCFECKRNRFQLLIMGFKFWKTFVSRYNNLFVLWYLRKIRKPASMIFNWVELSFTVDFWKVTGFSALEKCWVMSHLIREKRWEISIRSRWACIVERTVFVPVWIQWIQSWPHSCCWPCQLGDFHGGSEIILN